MPPVSAAKEIPNVDPADQKNGNPGMNMKEMAILQKLEEIEHMHEQAKKAPQQPEPKHDIAGEIARVIFSNLGVGGEIIKNDGEQIVIRNSDGSLTCVGNPHTSDK
jgi:hypothetical protein